PASLGARARPAGRRRGPRSPRARRGGAARVAPPPAARPAERSSLGPRRRVPPSGGSRGVAPSPSSPVLVARAARSGAQPVGPLVGGAGARALFRGAAPELGRASRTRA